MKISMTKDIAALRATAKVSIDAQAEAARLRYITPGSGQAMAYQEKYNEALAYLADPEIDEAEIPCIVHEVGATGTTKYEVAQVVVNLRSLWKPVNGLIEGARAHAKAAVDAATNPAEIDAAVAALAIAISPSEIDAAVAAFTTSPN